MEIRWPEQFPDLTTRDLLLRRVRTADAPGIFSCFANPLTMRYMGTPLDDPMSISGIVEDYISGFDEGYSIIWALEEKSTGSLVGTAGFEEFSFLDLKAETGFTILEEHGKKGLMRQAMEAILQYGFRTMALNRIQALIVPDNERAVRLVEKLGFIGEGHLRKSVFFSGAFHDQLVFSILKEERS